MPRPGHPTALILWLATVVVRRWAISCGVEPTHLMRKAIGAGVVVALASGALVTLVDAEPFGIAPAAQASRMVHGVSMGLFEGAMLSSILLVQSLGVVTGRLGLRMLPVSGRILGVGLGLPVLMVFVGVGALFTPVLVVLLGAVATLPPPHAAMLVIASSLTGASIGALTIGVLARALAHAGRAGTLAVPLALGLWGCGAALGLWRFQGLDAATAGTPGVDILLLWPLVVQAAFAGTSASIVGVGLLMLGSAALALLAFDPLALSTHGGGAAATPAVRWKAAGALPLVRLELLRLMRTRHVLQSLRSSAVLLAIAVAWMLWGPTLVTLGDGSALLGVAAAFVCVQTSLLSRGLSGRSRPYPLRLGFPPARWAWAVVAAGAIPGLLLGVPVLLALLLQRPLADTVLVAGFLLLLCAWGGVVGFVLHLDKDNTSGMAAGEIVLIVGGLSALALATFPHGFYRGKVAIGVTLVIAALVLAVLTGALETARWRSSLATAEEEPQ